MRTDTTEFSQYNQSESQEPVFVVEVAFDDAGEDVIYLTSHAVDGLAGEIFESALTDISGTTQKINPDKALSEIGALSFSALDDGLTTKQRAKLNAGLGLRGKRARFYVGFQGMDWSTYTLVQTQIIRSASYKDLVYSWKCSDIQREMRKSVFEVKSTALARTLEPGDTEVEVYNTTDFQTVKQPPSPSGKTDAPGQKVGYIILEEDSQKEIIRYTGTTSTKFTGCTRGVLGTRPIRVEKSDDEGADNAPKVEEYVYLEMPAPMLAYAILTGSIYGDPGETLPDHWHLGITAQYIRTADYVGIGEDLWEIGNPDNGIAARIAGVTDEDGKKFVEEELFLLMGCYAPVYSNGEIGLSRMTGVLSGASSTRTLSRLNITGYGSLGHDMGAIINRIVIGWNWVDQREEYTRTNLLIDQFSIDTHGDADLKQLEFRALHGSRHSYNTLRNRFDALRDRYAGPPLRLSLDLMPDQNDLEVGDIVRVQLDEIEDYTGEVTGIDRAFEIQQVKVNWKTGAVAVELFGSSQRAQPLAPEQSGAALPEPVYSVPGATEINGINFPGAVSSSNGITTIAADIQLTGADSLRDASAIYYCLEDLTINGGVTVTINKNTQIRVKGFFQINGKIDGRGRGYPGSPRKLEAGGGVVTPEQRFFGVSESQMGTNFRQGSEFNTDGLRKNFDTRYSHVSAGKNSVAPELSLNIQDDSLAGLPEDVTGQPGMHGVVSQYTPDLSPDAPITYAYGGAGGSGGAGVVIISSGAEFGASGLIDTSGGDGEPGESLFCEAYNAGFNRTMFGGRGAGGNPGAVYWLIVGATSSPPTLTNTSAVAETGATSAAEYSNAVQWGSGTGFYVSERGDVGGYVVYLGRVPNLPDPLSFEDPAHSARSVAIENKQSAAYKVQFLNGEIAPAPDLPEYSEKPAALTVTEALNTPKTPNANISTLEVSVTAPADAAYSYALVEYRPQGDAGWTSAGPASPEALITVASDGTTYEVRARSVSTTGVVSQDFASTTITTTKIIGADPGDPDVDEKIVIPPVSGLELEEQGNETNFGGRDAKFVWRATTIGQWFEIGSEGQLGAGAGELDLYFRDYQVEIWTQNRVVRTEWVKDPAYVYSYEKNAEDYARENLSPGAWRAFEIRVYCRGRLNQVSAKAASLAVQNPAPEGVLGLAITAGFNVIEIAYKRPTDLDFAGVEVWISEASGFDPDLVEPTANISDNSYVAGGLDQGKNYYVRLRPFDDFGIEGTAPTAEVMVTTKTGVDIVGLSGWAYEIDPADRAFIEANLAGEAIPSTKIENLTVAKLTGGVINATETITSEGVIRAVDDINNPQIQAGIGPIGLTRDGVPYAALMWAFDTQGVTFSIDELGNAYFQGDLEASTFTNDELTIDELGNLNSTGTFRFGGGADNFVDFNGTQLVIDTDNFSVDGAGNAEFSGDITAATFTNDELSIDSDGNVDSTGTFRFGGAANNFIDFNGTRLVIDTDNFSVDAAGNAGFLGTITGSTITGSTLQTSATGARVVISSATNALSTYDSSNVKVASIGENVTVDGNSKAVSVFGEASAFQDYGIYGRHYSGGRGMYGDSDGSGGEGVFGNSRSTTGTGRGVYGQSSGLSGTGGGGLGSAYGGRFTAAGNHGVYSIATDNVSYDFYAAGGAGLNYGPFTGGHDCLLSRQCEFEIGDILIATGEFEKGGVSQTMPYLNIASQSLSKAAYGVFIAKSELSIDERHRPAALQDYTTARMVYIGETHDRGAVNALGEGQINVCSESGNFEVGDFICTSNTAGKGMRYDGQDMRYVVAKCMEPVVWADEPDNIKMVACIYMCG